MAKANDRPDLVRSSTQAPQNLRGGLEVRGFPEHVTVEADESIGAQDNRFR